MKRKEKKRLSPRARFNLAFIISTAIILLVALITTYVLQIVFMKFDLVAFVGKKIDGWYWILAFIGTSIILGLTLAFIFGKMLFKPYDKIIAGMTRLSDGDFSTRIELGKYEETKTLAKSFNNLASELEKTEIFRSNFVNDFSHEIKTPIVSIKGLIGLLKNENLTPEQRSEYLAIMEEEATRLTDMTSNTLYLSKLETQEILTDKKTFNLSEQIRTSVLLLEKKWNEKELSLYLDFDEYNIIANEDMLRQVWLNLIDNAIKFSIPRGELKIDIEKNNEKLYVTVENQGVEIPESDYEAIFNKFYQCDSSRSTEGNGIGLSIVRHIIKLHNGEIKVKSENGRTAFTVIL